MVNAATQLGKRLTRLGRLSLVLLGLSPALLLVRPAPGPAQDGVNNVTVYTDTITIPTYACNTSTQLNTQFNVSYLRYESCQNFTVDRPYTRLTLENEYLRLSLLPGLGGRVYELIFKPTGHNEFYRNPVIKGTPWGRPEQNFGWLAAGGLEWALPLEEHGYEWGIPWSYTMISNTHGLSVTLRDSDADADRLRAQITVHLPADKALFWVNHRLENGRSVPLDFSYWTNAMLAPGAPNAPTGQLRFIIPGNQIQVHSRDPNDNFLPPEAGLMDWPNGSGRDMSRLGEWSGWFGFFAYPQSQANFAGVYDPSLQEGVMHIFPKAVVTGSKGFGFGWARPIDSHNWTDDGSGYVELHNGPQPTFWDTTHLAAGASLTYTGAWYPLAAIGGNMTVNTQFFATEEAALALTPTATGVDVGLFSPGQHPHARAVTRRLSDGAILDDRTFDQLDPTASQQWSVSTPGLTTEALSLVVFAEDGTVLVAANPLDDPTELFPTVWLPLVLKSQ
jgi:hypothetical protein